MKSHLLIVGTIVVAVLAIVHGQQTATLAGVVVEQGGGPPVPGVEVRATSETDPANSVATTTNEEGRFRFPDLPLGTYRIQYARVGFRTGTRSGVSVGVGQTAELRLEMRPDSFTSAEPPPPSPTPPGPTPGVSPGLAVVPVFFATDRAKTAADIVNYGSTRNPDGSLQLGRFDVSIPRDHQMGQVERPDVWTFWREDPTKHLVITSRKQQSYDEFYQDVRAVVNKSQRKEAFVFIHGFNVTFEGAVFRTAQIAYDLGFDGAPILYSWPSAESLSPIGYTTDSANNDWTVTHLRWFLEDVAAKSGAQRVHLIAHSMGNKALVNALDKMTQPATRKFSQIILTAPDIDADTFVQLADAVRRNGQMATLYASANDRALVASKKLQTYRRAGDTSAGVVVVPGIDTVDVSAVDTDLVGHSYYGDNTSVVSDIFLLLTQGLPPSRRPRLQAQGTPPKQFWRFAR